MTGTLYLCATPIGNLEDMTFRAVRILQEVDVVAAEDTRHTRKLLTHFDIHTPLVSYHEHNKLGRGPELIERLLAGESIACVSDAGMPGISDPGSHLAMLAIEAGITVTPVPGANAGLSALIASGLDTTEFHFIGFLSKQKKNRLETLARIKPIQGTLIFYESPHRLKDTLGELLDVLGDRNIVAARELTKKFEEFRRGTITELIAYY
ncbi:MAG: 16S rRNA (cytidine(1402)-2'-O)-methyltransferase, partial [Selenomonadales bacterium]|nr:16S rRNA (cytidine(1402)-2'-O)-methyltransferase [Selenomonadales bacterium]